jgi:DNA-binding beta-propeller fold protein YncE
MNSLQANNLHEAAVSSLSSLAAVIWPFLAIALAGVMRTSGQAWAGRWARRLLYLALILAALWLCNFLTGAWRYTPLRTVVVNRLNLVEGGKTEIIVSASRHPAGADLSPDGRHLLVSLRNSQQRLLINLTTREEQIVDRRYSHVRWLENDLFVGRRMGDGKYELVHLPDLKTTPLIEYPGNVEDVDSLHTTSKIYAVETLGRSGYTFVILQENQAYIMLPQSLEGEMLLQRLPNLQIVQNWPHMTLEEEQVGDSPRRYHRYYSPDGSLYQQASHGTRILQIFTTEGRQLVAQVQKRNMAPRPLGWSPDGRSFYFQMQGGGMELIREWPVYRLDLPDE